MSSSTAEAASARPQTASRPRTPRLFITFVTAFAVVIGHATIRSYGDQLRPVSSVHGLEKALFGGIVPTAWLQEHIQSHDLVWFDFLGFLAHGAWFFAPWVLAFCVMVARRRNLLELFAWVIATTYLASIVFLALPVQPPWMEIGSVRVLDERQFIHYVGVDNNQVAAMPSLHAALPFALGFFCLFRLRWRKAAIGFFAYALCVGFFVVYLGEHWVVDVLAGYVLASAIAFLFTSRYVARAVDALPGHPLQQFARFNAYWFPVRRPAALVALPDSEQRSAA